MTFNHVIDATCSYLDGILIDCFAHDTGVVGAMDGGMDDPETSYFGVGHRMFGATTERLWRQIRSKDWLLIVLMVLGKICVRARRQTKVRKATGKILMATTAHGFKRRRRQSLIFARPVKSIKTALWPANTLNHAGWEEMQWHQIRIPSGIASYICQKRAMEAGWCAFGMV